VEITLFSTTTCPYCKMLKDYLNKKQLAFQEKMVDTDEAARQEMTAVSNGFMGVPYVLIRKTDGTTEGIIGFDKGKLDEIFETWKNPASQK